MLHNIIVHEMYVHLTYVKFDALIYVTGKTNKCFALNEKLAFTLCILCFVSKTYLHINFTKNICYFMLARLAHAMRFYRY